MAYIHCIYDIEKKYWYYENVSCQNNKLYTSCLHNIEIDIKDFIIEDDNLTRIYFTKAANIVNGYCLSNVYYNYEQLVLLGCWPD